MSAWQGTLEQRNAEGLVAWKGKMRHSPPYLVPDAARPVEREYFTFSHGRKLEAARSFLDRVKYLKSYARRRGLSHLFT